MFSSGDGMANAHVNSQLWFSAQDLNMIKTGKCPRMIFFSGQTPIDTPLTANVCLRRVAFLCVNGHWSVTCDSVCDHTVLYISALESTHCIQEHAHIIKRRT